MNFIFSVKRDVDTNNDELIKAKELAITELGALLAESGQGEGMH
jgi:26S proteasome regulatory subunit N6